MNEHEMVPYQYMNSNGAMIGMIPHLTNNNSNNNNKLPWDIKAC